MDPPSVSLHVPAGERHPLPEQGVQDMYLAAPGLDFEPSIVYPATLISPVKIRAGLSQVNANTGRNAAPFEAAQPASAAVGIPRGVCPTARLQEAHQNSSGPKYPASSRPLRCMRYASTSSGM
jgi:hypothetical protein